MIRPDTPAQIAAALRVIADQLDAMPDRDQPSPVSVTVQIQPHQQWTGRPDDDQRERVAQVDRYAMALFGQPGRPRDVHEGRWQHTTMFDGRPKHPSGMQVDVFVGIDPPAPSVEQVAAAALTPDAVADDKVDYEAEIRGTRTDPSGRAAPIDLGDDPDGDLEGYDGALHVHSYAGDGLCDCERGGAPGDLPRSAEEEHAEAASEINERYPSPAPIADVEQAVKECGGVDPEWAQAIAQRDLWEDHARIAHRHLDELRTAVESLLAAVRLSTDWATNTVSPGAVGELRRALAGGGQK